MTTGEAVCRTYLQPMIGAMNAWVSSRSACAAQRYPKDNRSINVRPSCVAKLKGAMTIPKGVIITLPDNVSSTPQMQGSVKDELAGRHPSPPRGGAR